MFFNEVKKKLGFGCMRLPMIGEEVDIEQFKKMVDTFMEAGFNYFDTAHVYIYGKSETAIREGLVKRYPRESYLIANKLSYLFQKEEEILPVFNSQLEAMGVEYFDFYLMHAMGSSNYDHYVKCNAFKIAKKLKEEGRIRHLGISFHDSAEYLDKILTEQPDIEFVQIQFNYLDYDSANVQSKKCYDVCVKHNKPIIVMEPVKGGQLVNLPDYIQNIFDDLNKKQNTNYSNASFAIRFVASHPQIFMVLSGMSNLEQMLDNVSYMKDFKPLNELEMASLDLVRDKFNSLNLIPCTACRYCVPGCPMQIKIPRIFRILNDGKIFTNLDKKKEYNDLTASGGLASSCIKCGQCEGICPQHLSIRELLEEAAKVFE